MNDPRGTIPARHSHIAHLLPSRLLDVAPYQPRNFPEWPIQRPGRDCRWAPSIAELEQYSGVRFRNYQRDVLNCLSRFQLLSGGRRGGKTTICVMKTLRHAMFDVGNYFIGYPTKGQAFNTIFKGRPELPPDSSMDIRHKFSTTFDQVIPREYRKYPNKNYHENDMAVDLISGSTIFISGVEYKKGARATGDNYKMVVLPECANTKNLIYIYENNLQPALSKTKGITIFESAYYNDYDEFDHLRRRAERGEELNIKDEDGYPLYFNCVFTPVDYADTDFEWDQEVLHIGDRAALAQQFYQQRGWFSIHNSIIGQWFQEIKYQDGTINREHPVYCVWDIGGACNTSVWLLQHPHNFITRISGNRKTDPGQSTIYYLQKVRDYLEGCDHIIHVVPHDATAKKNLDHTIPPMEYLRRAGENVWQMPRCSSKREAIGNVIEYLREKSILPDEADHIQFDTDAREGVSELRRVKWKTINNVPADEPLFCEELDTFDAFLYAILLIAGKYGANLQWLAETYCPTYRWPGSVRPERCFKPTLQRIGGRVVCHMR